MSADKKRLFFALWPEAETRDAISAQTQALVSASGGRAVKPENLHLTLAFLHSVETHRLECIEAAAQRAACRSVRLQLSKMGYWYRSRILWLAPPAGAVGAPGTAGSLADALWAELEVCGFSPERRRFRPHVTLARRAKSVTRPDSMPTIAWQPRSFVLAESITGQRQSEYVVLKTFPLRGDSEFSR